eukprot:TRINITY_DN1560_c0_g1_i1.p1 TRINITY_DN1560_c0_g1~~TRINITY_DN1560_c0_g1_i1.p1  ORF type:complete len:766 (+),score=190.76 TRINITY_DN1560_c0_g1_i1:49-2346(+)
MKAAVFIAALAGVACKTLPVTTKTMDTRACQPGKDQFKFCNTSLSKAERLEDLVQQLKDTEIPSVLTARDSQQKGSKAIPRLGVPAYDWGGNCIHGVQSTCISDGNMTYCPTSFPNPVNLGASFNQSMWHTMGSVIGLELRSLWLNGGAEYHHAAPFIGLDCWSPNININRDPRWGRNQEVPGEDPYVNGLFGSAVTEGLQTSTVDSRYLNAVSTLKHWDAYTLEDSDGYTRHNFNAIVDNYTLADTFFPAWKETIVNGKALGVMCSYNAVNGAPTCSNKFLTETLRHTWNFSGYVTSDSGAVKNIYEDHKYVKTAEEAACVALKTGRTDVDSGSVYYEHLLSGIAEGHCSREDMNIALRNTYGLLFDMGLFDPVDDQPLWHLKPAVIGTPDHIKSSVLSARESMVLLKNKDDVLPFQKSKKTAVIGPFANAQGSLVGNYIGQNCPDSTFDCIESPSEAISNYSSSTVVEIGCEINSTSTAGFAAAIQAASLSDQVVLMMGINNSIEGESHDRTTIGLPGVQPVLMQQILKLGKPTVVVLINGGQLPLGSLIDDIPSLIDAFYPGQYGAQAIASTIFGENENLGGKMPYTVYPADYINTISMSEMSMNKLNTSGRTYKYYTGDAEFEFGFGLSFTTFELSSVVDQVSISCDDAVKSIQFEVSNTGAVTADDVWMLFAESFGVPKNSLPLKKRLVSFKRFHLTPKQSVTTSLDLRRDAFLHIADNGDRVCVPGTYSAVLTNGNNVSKKITVTITGSQAVVYKFPDV